MVDITTTSGFTCQMDEAAFDDIELLEEMVEVDKGKVQYLPSVLLRTLGAETRAALYDHVRNEAGIVTTAAILREYLEIIVSTAGGKK